MNEAVDKLKNEKKPKKGTPKSAADALKKSVATASTPPVPKPTIDKKSPLRKIPKKPVLRPRQALGFGKPEAEPSLNRGKGYTEVKTKATAVPIIGLPVLIPRIKQEPIKSDKPEDMKYFHELSLPSKLYYGTEHVGDWGSISYLDAAALGWSNFPESAGESLGEMFEMLSKPVETAHVFGQLWQETRLKTGMKQQKTYPGQLRFRPDSRAIPGSGYFMRNKFFSMYKPYADFDELTPQERAEILADRAKFEFEYHKWQQGEPVFVEGHSYMHRYASDPKRNWFVGRYDVDYEAANRRLKATGQDSPARDPWYLYQLSNPPDIEALGEYERQTAEYARKLYDEVTVADRELYSEKGTLLLDVVIGIYKQNWDFSDNGAGFKRYIAEEPAQFIEDVVTLITIVFAAAGMSISGGAAAVRAGGKGARMAKLTQRLSKTRVRLEQLQKLGKLTDAQKARLNYTTWASKGSEIGRTGPVARKMRDIGRWVERQGHRSMFLGTGVEARGYEAGKYLRAAEMVLDLSEISELPIYLGLNAGLRGLNAGMRLRHKMHLKQMANKLYEHFNIKEGESVKDYIDRIKEDPQFEGVTKEMMQQVRLDMASAFLNEMYKNQELGESEVGVQISDAPLAVLNLPREQYEHFLQGGDLADIIPRTSAETQDQFENPLAEFIVDREHYDSIQEQGLPLPAGRSNVTLTMYGGWSNARFDEGNYGILVDLRSLPENMVVSNSISLQKQRYLREAGFETALHEKLGELPHDHELKNTTLYAITIAPDVFQKVDELMDGRLSEDMAGFKINWDDITATESVYVYGDMAVENIAGVRDSGRIRLLENPGTPRDQWLFRDRNLYAVEGVFEHINRYNPEVQQEFRKFLQRYMAHIRRSNPDSTLDLVALFDESPYYGTLDAYWIDFRKFLQLRIDRSNPDALEGLINMVQAGSGDKHQDILEKFRRNPESLELISHWREFERRLLLEDGIPDEWLDTEKPRPKSEWFIDGLNPAHADIQKEFALYVQNRGNLTREERNAIQKFFVEPELVYDTTLKSYWRDFTRKYFERESGALRTDVELKIDSSRVVEAFKHFIRVKTGKDELADSITKLDDIVNKTFDDPIDEFGDILRNWSLFEKIMKMQYEQHKHLFRKVLDPSSNLGNVYRNTPAEIYRRMMKRTFGVEFEFIMPGSRGEFDPGDESVQNEFREWMEDNDQISEYNQNHAELDTDSDAFYEEVYNHIEWQYDVERPSIHSEEVKEIVRRRIDWNYGTRYGQREEMVDQERYDRFMEAVENNTTDSGGGSLLQKWRESAIREVVEDRLEEIGEDWDQIVDEVIDRINEDWSAYEHLITGRFEDLENIRDSSLDSYWDSFMDHLEAYRDNYEYLLTGDDMGWIDSDVDVPTINKNMPELRERLKELIRRLTTPEAQERLIPLVDSDPNSRDLNQYWSTLTENIIQEHGRPSEEFVMRPIFHINQGRSIPEYQERVRRIIEQEYEEGKNLLHVSNEENERLYQDRIARLEADPDDPNLGRFWEQVGRDLYRESVISMTNGIWEQLRRDRIGYRDRIRNDPNTDYDPTPEEVAENVAVDYLAENYPEFVEAGGEKYDEALEWLRRWIHRPVFYTRQADRYLPIQYQSPQSVAEIDWTNPYSQRKLREFIEELYQATDVIDNVEGERLIQLTHDEPTHPDLEYWWQALEEEYEGDVIPVTMKRFRGDRKEKLEELAEEYAKNGRLEDDSSLGNDEDGWTGEYVEGIGYEIPMKKEMGEEGLERVRELIWGLRSVGARTNKSCGLHVHIGKGDLTAEERENILYAWAKYQWAIDTLYGEWRNTGGEKSDYARSAYNKAGSPTIDPRKSKDLKERHYARYLMDTHGGSLREALNSLKRVELNLTEAKKWIDQITPNARGELMAPEITKAYNESGMSQDEFRRMFKISSEVEDGDALLLEVINRSATLYNNDTHKWVINEGAVHLDLSALRKVWNDVGNDLDLFKEWLLKQTPVDLDIIFPTARKYEYFEGLTDGVVRYRNMVYDYFTELIAKNPELKDMYSLPNLRNNNLETQIELGEDSIRMLKAKLREADATMREGPGNWEEWFHNFVRGKMDDATASVSQDLDTARALSLNNIYNTRFMSINMGGTGSGNITIEFRQMDGNLDEDRVIEYVKFLLYFVERFRYEKVLPSMRPPQNTAFRSIQPSKAGTRWFDFSNVPEDLQFPDENYEAIYKNMKGSEFDPLLYKDLTDESTEEFGKTAAKLIITDETEAVKAAKLARDRIVYENMSNALRKQWRKGQKKKDVIFIVSKYINDKLKIKTDKGKDRAKKLYGTDDVAKLKELGKRVIQDGFLKTDSKYRVAQARVRSLRINLEQGEAPNITGYEYESPAEIAVLAQWLRNAATENTWLLYLKGDTIVNHHALSLDSSLQGFAPSVEQLRTLMRKFEADSVVTIHNHPGGEAEFSPADIRIFNNMKREMGDQLRQAMITDSGEFAYMRLNDAGEWEAANRVDLPTDLLEWDNTKPYQLYSGHLISGDPVPIREDDPVFGRHMGEADVDAEEWEKTAEPHKRISRGIESDDTEEVRAGSKEFEEYLVSFGKYLQTDKNWITVAYTSLHNRLNAIVEYQGLQNLDPIEISQFLKQESKTFGGTGVHIFIGEGDWYRTPFEAYQPFRDIVDLDTTQGASDASGIKSVSMLETGEVLKDFRYHAHWKARKQPIELERSFGPEEETGIGIFSQNKRNQIFQQRDPALDKLFPRLPIRSVRPISTLGMSKEVYDQVMESGQIDQYEQRGRPLDIDKVRKAAQRFVELNNKTRVAEEFGVSQLTIGNWSKRPEWQEELDKLGYSGTSPTRKERGPKVGLEDKVRKAAQRFAEINNKTQVAEEFGVGKLTVINWSKRPEWQEVLDELEYVDTGRSKRSSGPTGPQDQAEYDTAFNKYNELVEAGVSRHGILKRVAEETDVDYDILQYWSHRYNWRQSDSANQVRAAARYFVEESEALKDIAAHFNVSQSAVSRWKQRPEWQEVLDELGHTAVPKHKQGRRVRRIHEAVDYFLNVSSSNADIVKHFNVSQATVNNWARSPEWHAELDRLGYEGSRQLIKGVTDDWNKVRAAARYFATQSNRVADVAKHFDVSERTVRNWRKTDVWQAVLDELEHSGETAPSVTGTGKKIDSDKVRAAARHFAEVSNRIVNVAKHFGVDPSTVLRWQKRPEWQEVLDELGHSGETAPTLNIKEVETKNRIREAARYFAEVSNRITDVAKEFDVNRTTVLRWSERPEWQEVLDELGHSGETASRAKGSGKKRDFDRVREAARHFATISNNIQDVAVHFDVNRESVRLWSQTPEWQEVLDELGHTGETSYIISKTERENKIRPAARYFAEESNRVEDVAKRFDISEWKVYRWMETPEWQEVIRELGHSGRTAPGSYTPRDPDLIPSAVRYFLNVSSSRKDIAEHFGVTPASVWQWSTTYEWHDELDRLGYHGDRALFAGVVDAYKEKIGKTDAFEQPSIYYGEHITGSTTSGDPVYKERYERIREERVLRPGFDTGEKGRKPQIFLSNGLYWRYRGGYGFLFDLDKIMRDYEPRIALPGEGGISLDGLYYGEAIDQVLGDYSDKGYYAPISLITENDIDPITTYAEYVKQSGVPKEDVAEFVTNYLETNHPEIFEVPDVWKNRITPDDYKGSTLRSILEVPWQYIHRESPEIYVNIREAFNSKYGIGTDFEEFSGKYVTEQIEGRKRMRADGMRQELEKLAIEEYDKHLGVARKDVKAFIVKYLEDKHPDTLRLSPGRARRIPEAEHKKHAIRDITEIRKNIWRSLNYMLPNLYDEVRSAYKVSKGISDVQETEFIEKYVNEKSEEVNTIYETLKAEGGVPWNKLEQGMEVILSESELPLEPYVLGVVEDYKVKILTEDSVGKPQSEWQFRTEQPLDLGDRSRAQFERAVDAYNEGGFDAYQAIMDIDPANFEQTRHTTTRRSFAEGKPVVYFTKEQYEDIKQKGKIEQGTANYEQARHVTLSPDAYRDILLDMALRPSGDDPDKFQWSEYIDAAAGDTSNVFFSYRRPEDAFEPNQHSNQAYGFIFDENYLIDELGATVGKYLITAYRNYLDSLIDEIIIYELTPEELRERFGIDPDDAHQIVYAIHDRIESGFGHPFHDYVMERFAEIAEEIQWVERKRGQEAKDFIAEKQPASGAYEIVVPGEVSLFKGILGVIEQGQPYKLTPESVGKLPSEWEFVDGETPQIIAEYAEKYRVPMPDGDNFAQVGMNKAQFDRAMQSGEVENPRATQAREEYENIKAQGTIPPGTSNYEQAQHLTRDAATYFKILKDRKLRGPEAYADKYKGSEPIDYIAGDTYNVFFTFMRDNDAFDTNASLMVNDAYGFIFDENYLINELGASVGRDLIDVYRTEVKGIIDDLTFDKTDAELRREFGIDNFEVEQVFDSINEDWIPSNDKMEAFREKVLDEFYRMLPEIHAEWRVTGEQAIELIKDLPSGQYEIIVPGEVPLDKGILGVIEDGIGYKLKPDSIGKPPNKWEFEDDVEIDAAMYFEQGRPRYYAEHAVIGSRSGIKFESEAPNVKEWNAREREAFSRVMKAGEIIPGRDVGVSHLGDVYVSYGKYWRREGIYGFIFDPVELYRDLGMRVPGHDKQILYKAFKEFVQDVDDRYLGSYAHINGLTDESLNNALWLYRYYKVHQKSRPEKFESNAEAEAWEIEVNKEINTYIAEVKPQIMERYNELRLDSIDDINWDILYESQEMLLPGPLPLKYAVGIFEDGKIKLITEATRGLPPSQWKFKNPEGREMAVGMTREEFEAAIETEMLVPDRFEQPVSHATKDKATYDKIKKERVLRAPGDRWQTEGEWSKLIDHMAGDTSNIYFAILNAKEPKTGEVPWGSYYAVGTDAYGFIFDEADLINDYGAVIGNDRITAYKRMFKSEAQTLMEEWMAADKWPVDRWGNYLIHPKDLSGFIDLRLGRWHNYMDPEHGGPRWISDSTREKYGSKEADEFMAEAEERFKEKLAEFPDERLAGDEALNYLKENVIINEELVVKVEIPIIRAIGVIENGIIKMIRKDTLGKPPSEWKFVPAGVTDKTKTAVTKVEGKKEYDRIRKAGKITPRDKAVDVSDQFEQATHITLNQDRFKEILRSGKLKAPGGDWRNVGARTHMLDHTVGDTDYIFLMIDWPPRRTYQKSNSFGFIFDELDLIENYGAEVNKFDLVRRYLDAIDRTIDEIYDGLFQGKGIDKSYIHDYVYQKYVDGAGPLYRLEYPGPKLGIDGKYGIKDIDDWFNRIFDAKVKALRKDNRFSGKQAIEALKKYEDYYKELIVKGEIPLTAATGIVEMGQNRMVTPETRGLAPREWKFEDGGPNPLYNKANENYAQAEHITRDYETYQKIREERKLKAPGENWREKGFNVTELDYYAGDTKFIFLSVSDRMRASQSYGFIFDERDLIQYLGAQVGIHDLIGPYTKAIKTSIERIFNQLGGDDPNLPRPPKNSDERGYISTEAGGRQYTYDINNVDIENSDRIVNMIVDDFKKKVPDIQSGKRLTGDEALEFLRTREPDKNLTNIEVLVANELPLELAIGVFENGKIRMITPETQGKSPDQWTYWDDISEAENRKAYENAFDLKRIEAGDVVYNVTDQFEQVSHITRDRATYEKIQRDRRLKVGEKSTWSQRLDKLAGDTDALFFELLPKDVKSGEVVSGSTYTDDPNAYGFILDETNLVNKYNAEVSFDNLGIYRERYEKIFYENLNDYASGESTIDFNEVERILDYYMGKYGPGIPDEYKTPKIQEFFERVDRLFIEDLKNNPIYPRSKGKRALNFIRGTKMRHASGEGSNLVELLVRMDLPLTEVIGVIENGIVWLLRNESIGKLPEEWQFLSKGETQNFNQVSHITRNKDTYEKIMEERVIRAPGEDWKKAGTESTGVDYMAGDTKYIFLSLGDRYSKPWIEDPRHATYGFVFDETELIEHFGGKLGVVDLFWRYHTAMAESFSEIMDEIGDIESLSQEKWKYISRLVRPTRYDANKITPSGDFDIEEANQIADKIIERYKQKTDELHARYRLSGVDALEALRTRSLENDPHMELLVEQPIPLRIAIGIIERGKVRYITPETRGLDPSEWRFTDEPYDTTVTMSKKDFDRIREQGSIETSDNFEQPSGITDNVVIGLANLVDDPDTFRQADPKLLTKQAIQERKERRRFGVEFELGKVLVPPPKVEGFTSDLYGYVDDDLRELLNKYGVFTTTDRSLSSDERLRLDLHNFPESESSKILAEGTRDVKPMDPYNPVESVFEIPFPGSHSSLVGSEGLKRLKDFTTDLRDLGNTFVNRTMGLHVHIENLDLSMEEWGNILRAWGKYEYAINLLYAEWRRYHPHKIYGGSASIYHLNPQQIGRSQFGLGDSPETPEDFEAFNRWLDAVVNLYENLSGVHKEGKYGMQIATEADKKFELRNRITKVYRFNMMGIDTAEYPAGITFEFRGHEGTLDPDKVTDYVDFLLGFIEKYRYAKVDPAPHTPAPETLQKLKDELMGGLNFEQAEHITKNRESFKNIFREGRIRVPGENWREMKVGLSEVDVMAGDQDRILLSYGEFGERDSETYGFIFDETDLIENYGAEVSKQDLLNFYYESINEASNLVLTNPEEIFSNWEKFNLDGREDDISILLSHFVFDTPDWHYFNTIPIEELTDTQIQRMIPEYITPAEVRNYIALVKDLALYIMEEIQDSSRLVGRDALNLLAKETLHNSDAEITVAQDLPVERATGIIEGGIYRYLTEESKGKKMSDWEFTDERGFSDTVKEALADLLDESDAFHQVDPKLLTKQAIADRKERRPFGVEFEFGKVVVPTPNWEHFRPPANLRVKYDKEIEEIVRKHGGHISGDMSLLTDEKLLYDAQRTQAEYEKELHDVIGSIDQESIRRHYGVGVRDVPPMDPKNPLESTYEIQFPSKEGSLMGSHGLERLKSFTKALQDTGTAYVNRTMGLHVHVQSKDLTAEEWGNILRAWGKYEYAIGLLYAEWRRYKPQPGGWHVGNYSSIYNLSDKKRNKDLYLKGSPTTPGEFEAFNRWLDKEVETIVGAAFDDKEAKAYFRNWVNKTFKFNMKGANRPDFPQGITFEFRGHEGTIDPDKVTDYVDFLLGFIEKYRYAKVDPAPHTPAPETLQTLKDELMGGLNFEQRRAAEHMTGKESFGKIMEDGKIKAGLFDRTWISSGGYFRVGGFKWGFLFDPQVLHDKYKTVPWSTAFYNNPDHAEFAERMPSGQYTKEYNDAAYKYLESRGITAGQALDDVDMAGEMWAMGDLDIRDAYGVVMDSELKIITEETRGKPSNEWEYREPTDDEYIDARSASIPAGVGKTLDFVSTHKDLLILDTRNRADDMSKAEYEKAKSEGVLKPENFEQAEHITRNAKSYEKVKKSGKLVVPKDADKRQGIMLVDILADDDDKIFLSYGRGLRMNKGSYGFVFDERQLVEELGATVGYDMLPEYNGILLEVAREADTSKVPQEFYRRYFVNTEVNRIETLINSDKIIDESDMSKADKEKARDWVNEFKSEFKKRVEMSQELNRYTDEEALMILETEREDGRIEITVRGSIPLKYAIGVIEDGKLKVIAEETRGLPPDQWLLMEVPDNFSITKNRELTSDDTSDVNNILGLKPQQKNMLEALGVDIDELAKLSEITADMELPKVSDKRETSRNVR